MSEVRAWNRAGSGNGKPSDPELTRDSSFRATVSVMAATHNPENTRTEGRKIPQSKR